MQESKITVPEPGEIEAEPEHEEAGEVEETYQEEEEVEYRREESSSKRSRRDRSRYAVTFQLSIIKRDLMSLGLHPFGLLPTWSTTLCPKLPFPHTLNYTQSTESVDKTTDSQSLVRSCWQRQ